MRNQILFLGVLCLLPPGFTVAEDLPAPPEKGFDLPGPLTLQQCLATALERNPDLEASQLDPVIAVRRVEKAGTLWLPRYAASAKYREAETPPVEHATFNRGNTSASVTTTNGFTGTLPTGLTYDLGADTTMTRAQTAIDRRPESDYDLTAGLTLTQPLLKGSGLFGNRHTTAYTIEVEKLNRQISLETLRQSLTNQLTTVESAFYDLQVAKETERARRASYAYTARLERESREKEKKGAASKLAVYQAQAGTARSLTTLLSATQGRREKENRLRELLRWHDEPGAPGRSLKLVLPAVRPPALVPVEEALRQGLSRRPEYLAQQRELEAKGLDLRYEKNQAYPVLDLSGGYQVTGGAGNFGNTLDRTGSWEGPDWNVSLSLSLPLGKPSSAYQAEIRELEQRKLLLGLKSLEERIVREVKNSHPGVRSAYGRTRAARKGVLFAQKSLAGEKVKLELGRSTVRDVLLEQDNLIAARLTQIASEVDYLKALADFAEARGVYLEEREIAIKSGAGK